MATYPVKNKETGEQKEVKMSVHDWDKWTEDNPDWLRDYSDPSTCLLYTSPSPRDRTRSRMPSSA